MCGGHPYSSHTDVDSKTTESSMASLKKTATSWILKNSYLWLGVGSGKEAGEDNNYGSSSFLFYLAWVDEHSAQEHPLNPCQIHMPGTKKCSAEGQVRTLNLGKLSGLMESALSVCCFSLIYNLSITLQEELLLRHLRKFRSQSKDFSIRQMQVDGLKVFFIFFIF